MGLDRAWALRHHHHQRSPGRKRLNFITTTGWHYVCPSSAWAEASGLREALGPVPGGEKPLATSSE